MTSNFEIMTLILQDPKPQFQLCKNVYIKVYVINTTPFTICICWL